MTKKITFGIIGSGMIATHHINSLLQIKEAQIKWLCDISNAAIQEKLEKYDIPNHTNNFYDILNDNAVDAIVICTPPFTHFQIASAAIKAKKHILLEKPIAISQQEVRALSKMVEQNPDLTVLDCAARHSRLQPKFSFIKEIVDSGELGHIYGIHHNALYRNARPGIEFNSQAQWFCSKNLSGGGPITDWGVYDLSFHLGLLNDVPTLKSIRSFSVSGLDKLSQYETFDIEEHGFVIMEFDNNLIYYWERASNVHNDSLNETRIYGTKGGLKFDYLSWGSNEVICYLLDNNSSPKKKSLYVDMSKHNTGNGYQSIADDCYAMSEHFVNCLIDKKQPILPFSSSVKNLEIIFESMRISPFKQQFKDNKNIKMEYV